MQKYLDPDEIQRLTTEGWMWLNTNILVWSTLVQALIVVAAYVVARSVAPAAERSLEAQLGKAKYARFVDPLIRTFLPLVLPVVWLVLQWFSVFAAQETGWPHHLIESAVSLLTAWVVIRLLSGAVRDPGWSKLLAVIAWSIAALNLVGLLDPTIATLDSIALTLGSARVSVLGVIKAGLVLAALLWVAKITAQLIENRLEGSRTISPSARVLLSKTIRVVLIIVAVFAALDSIGIDLTALAVFSGAVGLGVGFGLQKVISNLISGIILLMDKSVKPGDVIAIGDTFGWINSLSARYVSVITRDGIEHLIPNEELISQRVENWSYSNTLVRFRIPVGISYDSDIVNAMALTVEAATTVERVRADPVPVCRLMNFGDNAIELELRIWISDPQAGVSNVRSEVLLNIWMAFRENGIEFPFTQRDLHIKSPVPLQVAITSPEGPAGASAVTPKTDV